MTEKNAVLYRIDRAILSKLVRDARLTFRELGEVVGLSANAVAERVRRLVSAGVIRGFHADVDPAALGLRFHAYIDVKTGSATGPEQLAKLLAKIPEVRRAVWTTGDHDFTLQIVCQDQHDLVRIIECASALASRRPIRDSSGRSCCWVMVLKRAA